MGASPCHDCAASYYFCSILLFARRRQIGAAPMRHFRRHADALAQRGMRVNRLADIDRVGAHFYRQGDLADHVAGVGADHAAAQDLAVAVRFGAVVEQQLGETLVAAIGNRAA